MGERAHPQSGPASNHSNERARARRFWVATIAGTPVSGAVLFVAAGTLAWPGAWWLLAVSFVAAIASGLVIPPDLAAERGGIGEGTAAFDKVLAPLVARVLPLATFVAAGLDHRYGGSPSFGSFLLVAGLVAVVAGSVLVVWAMASNRFFAPVVRVQTDRGHRVIDTGPYAIVRHPGYTGMLSFTLGTPLLLGSLWAVAPTMVTVVLTVLRTSLEDRLLKRELDGYPAYATRVRFRLLPGVW